MNKRLLGMIAVAAMGVMISMPASATSINISEPQFSKSYVDTQTGLTWLMPFWPSYNQVQAQLGPGGLYYGFSIATWQQIDQLFANAGVYSANTTQDFSGPIALVWSLGPTACVYGQLCVADGLYDPGYPVGPGDLVPNVYVGINYDPVPGGGYNPATVTGVYVSGGAWFPSNVFTPNISVWLVSTSPVPESSTLALLGIGIIGLIGYGWRKRKG